MSGIFSLVNYCESGNEWENGITLNADLAVNGNMNGDSRDGNANGIKYVCF